LFGDWEAVKVQRKNEFEDLLMRAQQLKHEYDCLVPLSGGKDSTYALYLCAKVYKLKCLAVTFDNGFLTEHARTNIRSALKAAGADHFFYTIDRNLLLKLYRHFLAKSGDFCSVCMRGITVAIQRAVSAFSPPLVVTGSAKRISYLYSFPEVFQGGDQGFFSTVLDDPCLRREAAPLLAGASRQRQAVAAQLRRIGLKSAASKLLQIARSAAFRSQIVPESLVPRPVIYVGPYDYMDVSPVEVCGTIRREMGWKSPPEELEHIDCALHELPFYIHTRKFPALSMHTFYRSSLVRRGLMTREEAIRAEERELATLTAPAALEPFLDEIGMSAGEFESSVLDWRMLDAFRQKA
jgi:hypothetical protein